MNESALKALFASEGIDAQAAPELSGFRAGFSGEHGKFLLFTKLDERAVTFYAIAPFSVAPPRRAAMNELVTRANFGLPAGCFELDLDDGELRFRVTALDTETLRPFLWASVAGLDRYLPALTACAQGAEAQDALALVEGEQ